MHYPNFCGPSNPTQAYTADQERTVNLYFEKMLPASSSKSALYPFPGLATLNLAILSDAAIGGAGRAHIGIGGREFAIFGHSFVEIYEDGSYEIRGTVLNDGLPATIDSNGDGGGQLFIASGNSGHIYDLTTNTGPTLIPALSGIARFGAQLDGYFLALDVATSTVYFSALLDGTSWTTGTDFWQRSGTGDPWVSMKVNRNYIYLFGEQTSEVWYDTGASFPFARHPSGQFQVGCSAPFSPAIVDGTVCWLGGTATSQGSLYRISGFAPEPISNPSIEHAISQYETIEDAQGDTFSVNGHHFYVLGFPTENKASWVWDSTNGLFVELGRWQPEQSSDFVMWPWRWAVQIFGQTRILATDRAYYAALSQDTQQEKVAGDELPQEYRRLRRAPVIMDEMERVYISEFTLDIEPATFSPIDGAESVANLPVMMRQSRDGGKTWGSERWITTGAVGQYGTRLNWHRCGQGRRMVFEVSFVGRIQFRITNAYLKLKSTKAESRVA